ncbi:MAG: hypothetical protein ACJ8IK_13870 [Burkholderiaceae bacterium]
MIQWNGWPVLVAEEALVAVALLVVYEGCRRLARDGMSRLAALMVAIGLVVPVGDAWLSMQLIKQVRELQATKMLTVAVRGREPAGGWEKAASAPEGRSLASMQAAHIAYMYQGERTSIVDLAGARVPYQPSADEMKDREQFVRDEKGAESTALLSWERGIRLLIEAGVFLAAGLAVGWRARRRT